MSEPTSEPTSEPMSEPLSEPISEHMSEPITESMNERRVRVYGGIRANSDLLQQLTVVVHM